MAKYVLFTLVVVVALFAVVSLAVWQIAHVDLLSWIRMAIQDASVSPALGQAQVEWLMHQIAKFLAL